MIQHIWQLTVIAISISIIAYVYVMVLQESNMLLGPVKRWLNDFSEAKFNYVSIENNWLFKPWFSCLLCVSGQMALWFYVFQYQQFSNSYNFFYHIYLISASIFFGKLLLKIHELIKL